MWVIDAKCYDGQVTRRRAGGWLSDIHLFIGRRDCSKLVSAVSKQVEVVRTALGEQWAGVPVRPMLCFVGASWPWYAKPFELEGVMVTWPAAACRDLLRSGAYPSTTMEQIAAKLDRRLRPAA